MLSSPHWRVEALFPPILFPMGFAICIFMIRCLTLRSDAVLQGRWLRQSQSILTQAQQTNDLNSTCCKTLPPMSATCLHVGPMSFEKLVAPPAGSDRTQPLSSHEDPNDQHPKGAFPAHPPPRWRRDSHQPPHIRVTLDRNTRFFIIDDGLRYVTLNTGVIVGSVTSSQISRESKHNCFSRHRKQQHYLPPKNTWER